MHKIRLVSATALALARRGTMTAQLEAQSSLRDAARVGYRLSEARFRAGVDPFLTTLDAQRTLYNAERSMLATRLARAANMIELYRAMGGGLNSTLGYNKEQLSFVIDGAWSFHIWISNSLKIVSR